MKRVRPQNKLEQAVRQATRPSSALGPAPCKLESNGAVGSSEAWPEPLDIIGAPELVGWPEITADCLPDPLFHYVMAEAERLNIDPAPLAGHVLSACSASISDAWRIKPKRHDHWTQQARVWCCVVKDVGQRGTEMIRSGFWPVKKRDADAYEQWKGEHAAWTKRQAKRKKGNSADDDPEPKLRRFTTSDATIEAASQILADAGGPHAKLTVVADELTAFLGSFGRYSPNGASARAQWLESFDGGQQRIDRIKRGHIYVPNWSLVISGNIQPRRLARMGKDLIDDGLFQRFMTIHAKPATTGINDDQPLPGGVGRDYRELHKTLAELMPPLDADDKLAAASFDHDARAVREKFKELIERLQVDPTLPAIIRETASKWSGLLARLSLIFHLVGLADRQITGATLTPHDLCRVTGPTVTMAASFLKRIVLPNLFRLGFETMPEEGAPAAHARWIAGYILTRRAEHIAASEIGRAYRPLRGKPGEIAEAMAVLNDVGWTTPSEARHDGARWSINPAVHQVFEAAALAERERRMQVRQAIAAEVADLVVDARPENLDELLQQGLSIEDAATQLGISRATAYRWRPRAKQ